MRFPEFAFPGFRESWKARVPGCAFPGSHGSWKMRFPEFAFSGFRESWKPRFPGCAFPGFRVGQLPSRWPERGPACFLLGLGLDPGNPGGELKTGSRRFKTRFAQRFLLHSCSSASISIRLQKRFRILTGESLRLGVARDVDSSE